MVRKKEVPKDPWGNDFVYTSPGEHGEYDLLSYGADNVEGGEKKQHGYCQLEMIKRIASS